MAVEVNKIICGDMKIKALAPWFGGKRNLAPRIVELLAKAIPAVSELEEDSFYFWAGMNHWGAF